MMMAIMNNLKIVVAAVAAAAALVTAPFGDGHPTAADHTLFPAAVLDLAEQISAQVEAVADQAAEEARGITPTSPVMEALVQGISELEAQMDQRLTRLEHRAVAAVRRIDNPHYDRVAHYLQKPPMGRLEGARSND